MREGGLDCYKFLFVFSVSCFGVVLLAFLLTKKFNILGLRTPSETLFDLRAEEFVFSILFFLFVCVLSSPCGWELFSGETWSSLLLLGFITTSLSYFIFTILPFSFSNFTCSCSSLLFSNTCYG